jgi:hypothetical protein
MSITKPIIHDGRTFRFVPDENIKMVWSCKECGEVDHIKPVDITEVGTPMCGICECDLTYVGTFIAN